MNPVIIESARRRVPNVFVLINMVSKRVRQLVGNYPQMVRSSSPYENREDVAMREIAEGKLVAEIDLGGEAKGGK